MRRQMNGNQWKGRSNGKRIVISTKGEIFLKFLASIIGGPSFGVLRVFATLLDKAGLSIGKNLA